MTGARKLDQPLAVGSHDGLAVTPQKLAELGLSLDELAALPRALLDQLSGLHVAGKRRPVEKMMRSRSGEWAMLTVSRNGVQVERGEVRVMARAEGYAMVRHKGCMPFVCSERELTANVRVEGPP